MSNHALNLAWSARGLSGTEKLVLVRLADMTNPDTGLCWPGQTKIARECCLTTRAVRNAIKSLTALGHVVIERAPTANSTATYRVIPLPPEQLSPPEPRSGPERDSPPECGSGPERDSRASGTAFLTAPEPCSGPLRNGVPPNPKITIIEPKMNPHEEFALGSEVKNSPPEERLIAYLNEKAGRQFRPTEGNLKLARCRLAEVGGDVDGVKVMIDRMVAKWGTDPKMAEFLQPQTLFGKEKFHGYYDNRLLPVLSASKAGSRPVSPTFPGGKF